MNTNPSAFDIVDLWEDRATLAVERWLSRQVGSGGRELEEASSERIDPDVAYDILVSWASSRRLLPELAEMVRNVVVRLDVVVANEGPALVHLALAVPSIEGWLAAARAWSEESQDPHVDDVTAARRARELLTDLDDAELVAWAAEQLVPGSATDLEAGLARCVELATELPELFAPAGAFVRALSESLDPALAGREPRLALTQVAIASAVLAADELLAELEGLAPDMSAEEVAYWRVEGGGGLHCVYCAQWTPVEGLAEVPGDPTCLGCAEHLFWVVVHDPDGDPQPGGRWYFPSEVDANSFASFLRRNAWGFVDVHAPHGR